MTKEGANYAPQRGRLYSVLSPGPERKKEMKRKRMREEKITCLPILLSLQYETRILIIRRGFEALSRDLLLVPPGVTTN